MSNNGDYSTGFKANNPFVEGYKSSHKRKRGFEFKTVPLFKGLSVPSRHPNVRTLGVKKSTSEHTKRRVVTLIPDAKENQENPPIVPQKLTICTHVKQTYSHSELYPYNLEMAEAIKRKDFPAVLTIYDTIIREGIKPDIYTYNNLITAYANDKQPQKAREIFEVMQNAGIAPDQVIFNSLINAYAQVGWIDQALQTYHLMKTSNFMPDAFTYSSLINAFAESSQPGKAWEFYESMLNSGFIPNKVVFLATIKACSIAKQPIRAWLVFESMRKNYPELELADFNALLNAFAQDGLIEWCLVAYTDMLNSKIVPDQHSFSLMMQACIRADRSVEVWQILQIMMQAGIQPNSSIFNALIKASIHLGQDDVARQIYVLMLNLNCTPDHFTMSAVHPGSV